MIDQFITRKVIFSIMVSKLSVKYALDKELRKLFKIQNCNSILQFLIKINLRNFSRITT